MTLADKSLAYFNEVREYAQLLSTRYHGTFLVGQIVCEIAILMSQLQRRRKIKKEKRSRQGDQYLRMADYVLVFLTCMTALSIWSKLDIDLPWKTTPNRSSLQFTGGPDLPPPNLFNATIREIQHGLELGQYNSLDLVEAYMARIEEVNSVLHAVIETAPVEVMQREAKMLDEERVLYGPRGYLHGVPILVKDNIETDVSLGMNTTAGSFALLNSVPSGDAPIIARLRKAGAIILGKTNMSVWAQARGNTTQGWSPRGGYTSSAYHPNGNACSSSSGAGVAASIGLSAGSVGTETDGSIICPASRNGVVGFKPTVGLTSRFGIVPISSSQDTPGPIVQSVEDAAILLTAMFTPKDAEQVSLDKAVSFQPKHVARGIDYARRLMELRLEDEQLPLANVRIGVLRGNMVDPHLNGYDSQVVDIYYDALDQLEAAGATLVNVSLSLLSSSLNTLHKDRDMLLAFELDESINTYLSYLKSIPSGIFNLAGLIDFAYQHSDLELPIGDEDQSRLIQTLYSPMFAPIGKGDGGKARRFNQTYSEIKQRGESAHEEMLQTMQKHHLSAIVGPSDAVVHSLAAKVGSPSITVPAGFLRSSGVKAMPGSRPIWPFNGAPVGLCFISTRWQEESLLKVARGYEVWQTRHQRGSHDGVIRTYKQATPTTQLKSKVMH